MNKAFESLLTDILAELTCRDRFCVGINGLDCSGKTFLAEKLRAKLEQNAVRVELLHVDDFNNRTVQTEIYSKFERGYFNESDLNHYYQHSVDYSALLQAIQTRKEFPGVLLVEGVFLFKSPMNTLFDRKVFLETNYATARERYELRRSEVGDTRPVEVFDDIWLPAYNKYCREYDVLNSVDCIIHN